MKLEDRGKGVMNSKEYALWRETGMGFELREADYSIQNRTFASGLVIRKVCEGDNDDILIIHISSCISGRATCIEDIYNVAKTL